LINRAPKGQPRLCVKRAGFAAIIAASTIAFAMCTPTTCSLAQNQGGQHPSGSSSTSGAPPEPAAATTQANSRNTAGGSSAEHDVTKKQKQTSNQPLQPAKAVLKNQRSAAADSRNTSSDTPFGSFASSNRGPIGIQSDSLALDYKGNGVVFRGHVRATQADGTLTSNILNVKYGKDFHQVQYMTADGNVHISQGVRWCTSDHAVMDQSQHTVVLTGSPICHDARDQIAGTRITVHLDSGKSDVQSAKAVIFPQQSKTRDNEAFAGDVK
jgi:lipopolysaccharide transport protein LptA